MYKNKEGWGRGGGQEFRAIGGFEKMKKELECCAVLDKIKRRTSSRYCNDNWANVSDHMNAREARATPVHGGRCAAWQE